MIQFQYCNLHDIANNNPRRITSNLGKGDLVGCDINKHLLAQTAALTFPSGNAAQPYSLSGGHSNNHQRRPSIGAMPMSEVVVKSNADIRALTYCDLKVQLNPNPAKIILLPKLFILMILTWTILLFLVFEYFWVS